MTTDCPQQANGQIGTIRLVLPRACRRRAWPTGDEIELIERPHPGFSFERLVAFANHGTASRADLAALSQMNEVGDGDAPPCDRRNFAAG